MKRFSPSNRAALSELPRNPPESFSGCLTHPCCPPGGRGREAPAAVQPAGGAAARGHTMHLWKGGGCGRWCSGRLGELKQVQVLWLRLT